ncbi:DUF1800 family protein [Haloferula sp.]|uniref:DUF1800 family protein n=1 Tax=Haloferula sp. TaxID=2497595 RepID=UPI00329F32C6
MIYPLLTRSRLWPLALSASFFAIAIASSHAVDLDTDGLSDFWQQRYGAQSLTALDDTDGDKFTNSDEAIAGTDPFDGNDFPIVGPIWTEAGGDPFHLSIPTKAGKDYQLFQSPNLLNFTPVGSSIIGDGSPATFTLSQSAFATRDTTVTHELWANVTGNDLTTLTSLPTFPHSPDGATTLSSFETSRVLPSGFGGRMRALITPPETGQFIFSLSSGGSAELRMSPSPNPGHLFKVADVLEAQTGIAPGSWDTFPNQQTNPIFLTAGNQYLLEVRYLASTSRSHCQVAWSGPGITGTELLPASALVPAPFIPLDVSPSPIFSHDYDTTGQAGTLWPQGTAITAAPVGMSGNAEHMTGDAGSSTAEESAAFTSATTDHLYATWLFNMAPDHRDANLYFKNGSGSSEEGPRIDLEDSGGTTAVIRPEGSSAKQIVVTFNETYRVEIVASLVPGGFTYHAGLATYTVAEDTFDIYVSDINGTLVGSAQGLLFKDQGADVVQAIDHVRLTGVGTDTFPNIHFDDWEVTAGSIAGNGYLTANNTGFTLNSDRNFFRAAIDDIDQDGDGIPDWEEIELAAHHNFLFFDSETTDGTPDASAANALLATTAGPIEVSLVASDTAAFESNSPNLDDDHGEITLIRSGPLTPVTINICQAPLASTGNTQTICDGTCCTLIGSAGDEEAEASDYSIVDADGNIITNQVSFAYGEMVKVLTVIATLDSENEYPETVNTALELDDAGSYTISATNGASIQLFDLPEHPDNVALFTGTFSLDGAAVVPSDGSGFTTATINGPRTEMRFWDEFSNLTSSQQDSHIHKSNVGPAPGAIIYAITNVPGAESGEEPDSDPLNGPIADYPWDLTTSSGAVPSSGGEASKQTIIDSLFNQNGESPLYLNIHTVDNPAGEIWAFLALSGGSQTSPGAPPVADAPGSAGYPQITDSGELEGEVRRFLNQATFGATDAEVTAIVSDIETERLTDANYHRHTAFEAWIDDQMNPAVVPQTYQLDYHLATDWQFYVLAGTFDPARNPDNLSDPLDPLLTPTRPSVWPTIDRTNPNPEHWHLSLAYPINRDDLDLIDDNGLIDPDNRTRRQANWQMMLNAKDQLRQKAGFALQQIVVISTTASAIDDNPYGASNYQDMLNYHAFGHYRDVLGYVNWSPMMGKWLSSLQNQKAADLDDDGSFDIFPDENLAREDMQLFSIGLFELWPDGSLRLGSDGLPIPTYTNDDIREFAKVLTGQSFGRYNSTSAPYGGVPYDSMVESPDFVESQNPNGLLTMRYSYPMKMFGDYHDLTVKTFAGTTIDNTDILDPSEQGVADIEDAMDWLAGKPGDGQPDFDMVNSHRSVPAFICRRLIQRMVTSNPSTAYLHRVATTFKDSEGDLGLTIKAILLDPEARRVDLSDTTFGMKKSPLEGYIQMVRSLESITHIPVTDPGGAAPFDTAPGDFSNPDLFLDNFGLPAAQLANQWRNVRYLYNNTITSGTENLQMTPFHQETVFNWYLPDYSPGGPVSEAGLVAPELQLANEPDVIRNINYFETITRSTNGISIDSLAGRSSNQRLALGIDEDDSSVDNNDRIRLDRVALAAAFYPATAPAALPGRSVESTADEMLVDELDRRLTYGFFKRRYPYDPSDDDDPDTPGVDDLLKNPRELIIDGLTDGHNDPFSGSNDDADKLNKLSDALYLLTFSPEYQIKK